MDRLFEEVLNAAALKETIDDPIVEKEGFDAYEDGACEMDNPYEHGTLNHWAWETGWDRGFEHYYREREMDEKDANDLRRHR